MAMPPSWPPCPQPHETHQTHTRHPTPRHTHGTAVGFLLVLQLYRTMYYVVICTIASFSSTSTAVASQKLGPSARSGGYIGESS